MKLWCKYLFLIIVVAIVDFVSGIFFESFFKKVPDTKGQYSQVYHSLSDKTAEVLILGASTAKYHYDSRYLSNTLHSKVYNAGMYGYDVVYADVVLESFLSRCSPQKVVLDISHPGYLNGGMSYRTSLLKCYYGMCPAVTNYFQMNWDLTQRVKLYSSLYRFNKTLALFRSYCEEPDTLLGFEPLSGTKKIMKPEVSNNFVVDSNDYKALLHIVEMCKRSPISLYVVLSPSLNTDKEFEVWLKKFCKDNQIQYLDIKNDSYWSSHLELFHDEYHLNSEGAKEFSRIIANQL